MPAVELNRTRKESPKFLLSRNDLLARDPKWMYSSLSLSLVDFGSGANNLITFRKLDDESDLKHIVGDKESRSVETSSRGGLVGRTLWGVFQKLFIVSTFIFFLQ